MPSYGDETVCPGCGTTHVVRVGDINSKRHIEFVCACCGGIVNMEHDGSHAVIAQQNTGKPVVLNFTKGD